MSAVCRTWRTAVQQATTRALCISIHVPNTDIEDNLPSKGLTTVASFASWLPKYAGLVHCIGISSCSSSSLLSDDSARWRRLVVEPMLALGLEAAARPAATSQSQQPAAALQLQQALQLQVYKSNVLHGTAVLQALPAASLIELDLTDSSVSALAAALPRLTQLQRLQLEWDDAVDVDECMPAISQLSSLTYLQLKKIRSLDTARLPAQLEAASLHYADGEADGVLLPYEHLTQLTRLTVLLENQPLEGSALPAQLEHLTVDSLNSGTLAVSIFKMTSLQHLRRLSILNCQDFGEELLALGEMPQLQHLELDYDGGTRQDVVRVSSVWQQLRQLKSLRVWAYDLNLPSFWEVLHNITAVSGLTQLSFEVVVYQDEGEGGEEVQHIVGLCDHIAKLTGLQALALCCSCTGSVDFMSGDAHHLSVLTT